ncbi:hypothetical protein BURK_009371 [Burkholderia sp. SJ98]|uniref:hypothetical protein n=1 Tax=Caballeronia TaxID=1827195 RepID=UPI00029BEC52|nr:MULTISPECIES: hypothetical protein [Caballeronia]EKS72031.1 hypothetical protein BURK_009371 [Burkholderia sp. SJ98]
MRIAFAPCAAGEGDSHPSETHAFSTDNTNLPWVILRAVHRAAQLDGISTRARAVLAALARTVDAQKPFAEIFARRTLLSERAMQSERTFYRSLADLEQAGLIERPAQRRYVEAGLFGRAYLHLTPKATMLLGLVEDTREETTGHPQEEQDALVVSQRFAHPSANVADGANTKDLNPNAFQKRQPGHVPQDLQRLRSLGFLDFLIFKLMREARESGKRLSDVVEVCWPHLRQAKRPINYLRTLLSSTTDFGHQLRAKAETLALVREADRARANADVTVRALDGQSFLDPGRKMRYTVADAGTTLTVQSLLDGVVRRAAGQWAVGFVAALTEGRITPEEGANHSHLDVAVAHRPSEIERSSLARPRELTMSVSEHLSKLRALCRRA